MTIAHCYDILVPLELVGIEVLGFPKTEASCGVVSSPGSEATLSLYLVRHSPERFAGSSRPTLSNLIWVEPLSHYFGR